MKNHIILILLLLSFAFAGCARPSEAEVKVLELAVYYTGSQLSGSELIQAVNTYNENNSVVKIEVINYSDNYPDAWEALNQIKIEIIAGKGPDMIDFGSAWGYSPLVSGMMADLYPLMQNDALFDRQDFYFNIIESFAVGESLYVLVPSFRITSFATNNSELSNLERMNINQLVDAYNKLDDESILFPGETKKSVLAMICFGGMENYIDWGQGIAYFDGSSFKEILNFANQFSLTLNISDDYSAKAFFTEGRALLYPVSIDSVYGTARVRMLYGETPAYIGYPFDSGNGNIADFANIAIGISGVSKNKEEAWGFIKTLLDNEFQDNLKRGLPVRISSLEQKLLGAMEIEYDINGGRVVKERLIWDGEEPADIYQISAEDAETLKSIIKKIEFNATVDSAVYNIMLEEADYLFNDDSRNVDDVADIIQNRASIYLKEIN
ncbi:MAG: extracellular solute-binding protein [Lachnospiraceae bacterium]|nr:extracellular solute-binding protein [Lachnospiraceae bacterium]